MNEAPATPEGRTPVRSPSPASILEELNGLQGVYLNLGKKQNAEDRFAILNLQAAIHIVEAWFSPGAPGSAKEPTAPPRETSPFDFLVAGIAASHDVDNARPLTIDEAIAELAEHHDWIGNDQDEDAPAIARLENVAAVIAAARRLADVLIKDVSPEDLTKAIAENQP